jgi:hypothetical protein
MEQGTYFLVFANEVKLLNIIELILPFLIKNAVVVNIPRTL